MTTIPVSCARKFTPRGLPLSRTARVTFKVASAYSLLLVGHVPLTAGYIDTQRWGEDVYYSRGLAV